MNIAEKAFAELFPEKKQSKALKVRYSKAFNAYNANVKYTSSSMVWVDVGERNPKDIVLGM